MKCPRCGADSHILDTRQAGSTTTHRRRECEGDDTHRFVTVEIHVDTYRHAVQRLTNSAIRHFGQHIAKRTPV